jgi:hypothetical protein
MLSLDLRPVVHLDMHHRQQAGRGPFFCVLKKLSCSHHKLRRFSSLALVFVLCVRLAPDLTTSGNASFLRKYEAPNHRVRMPSCRIAHRYVPFRGAGLHREKLSNE